VSIFSIGHNFYLFTYILNLNFLHLVFYILLTLDLPTKKYIITSNFINKKTSYICKQKKIIYIKICFELYLKLKIMYTNFIYLFSLFIVHKMSMLFYLNFDIVILMMKKYYTLSQMCNEFFL
jgi:hypothetical protein